MNFPVSITSKFSTEYLMDYEIFHSSWWEKTLFLFCASFRDCPVLLDGSFLALWLHILVSIHLNSSGGGYPLQLSRVPLCLVS